MTYCVSDYADDAIFLINYSGLGYTMVVISLLIGCYYNIIITYTLRYLFDSLGALKSGILPWESCENSWNTPKCMDVQRLELCAASNASQIASFPFNCSQSTTNSSTRQSPSEQYWKFNVLDQSDSIEEIGSLKLDLVLLLGFAYLILFVSLAKVILDKVFFYQTKRTDFEMKKIFFRGSNRLEKQFT